LGTSPATATIAIDPNREGNSATTTITNNGIITTQSGSIDNYAIAVGSPVNTTLRVINNGTIIGKWEQYQNGAAVTNNYVWNTTGTNNFKGGGNSITNSAGAVIQSQGDSIFVMDGTDNSITNAGTIRTIGGKLTLDPPNNTVTVYNSGLIDMVNDGSSSVANVVQIDGNFVASGNSAVAVNTQLGGAGSQSDRLLIVGNASGTNTSVIVKDTKGGVGAYNPFGTAIVGYGGTSTGGFTLSSQSDHFAFRNGMSTLNKGLYFYYIGQGTGSTGCDAGYTCYSLYSAPSTAAKSLPIAVTAAQSLWQETALMWEDRQVELRDELTTRAYAAGNDPSVSRNNVRYNTALKPQDGGISTWIKSVGAWTNRSNYQTQWGGGGAALSYDLSYRQNSLGMLGGADWSKAGFLTPKDYLVVGVMGGYLNSSVNFNQEAGNVLGQENFTYQGGTIGGSISYMLNGFFADALFKNDMLRSNMKIPVIGLTGSSTGVNTAGGVGNLGYRLNYGSMFFEPMATLTYSNTYMGGLNDLGAQGVNVSFGPGNDFRGGFGGRVGSSFGNIISNHMLELSLTGRYWNMFNSNAGRTATIVSDFTPETIGDYTLGRDYGEIKGNVNVFSLGSGVSAFINTGVRFNDHFQTVITKGGLAYRF
jgi:outer membrane autotransporter protein